MEKIKNENSSLRANTIGLVGAITLGIVMLSPAMTIYGNFGPAFLSAEKASPLIFLWALIATLPTALSYTLLSRDYPNSGSAASWIAQTGLHQTARWAGWMVFFYYLTNFVIQPITVGVFLNDILKNAGFSPNLGSYFVGVLVCCGWGAWMVYRGVSLSVNGALAFLIFESAVVIALCATVFIAVPHDGNHFSLEGFHIASAPQGVSSLFRGMVFGMLAFCGFDVISTLSEETKMARTLIPQATLIALGLFGAIIISAVWILSYAASASQLRAISDAGGMPISEIARIFWGKGSIFVSLTAISAALGITIATAIGSSRVLMFISREGNAPAKYAVLHEKYRVPWNAMHVIFAVGLVASIITASVLGPYQTFVWWGTTSTFFAMLTYLAVNLANILVFKNKIFKTPLQFCIHGLIPVIGIALDGYILIESFFIELWKQGWAYGQSVIVFDLLCAGLGLYFAVKTGNKIKTVAV